MRPRNKIEREVVSLYKSLSKGLTPAQYRWAYETQMERCLFVTNKKGWCSVCGEEFECSPKDYVANSQMECPHCHRKGKVIQSRKTTLSDAMYVQTISVHKGWQVVRYFYVEPGGRPSMGLHRVGHD